MFQEILNTNMIFPKQSQYFSINISSNVTISFEMFSIINYCAVIKSNKICILRNIPRKNYCTSIFFLSLSLTATAGSSREFSYKWMSQRAQCLITHQKLRKEWRKCGPAIILQMKLIKYICDPGVLVVTGKPCAKLLLKILKKHSSGDE